MPTSGSKPSGWKVAVDIVKSRGHLRKIAWDGTTKTLPEWSVEERAMLGELDSSIRSCINFAGDELDPTNVDDLHRQLSERAAQFTTADPRELDLLAFAILATWVPERTPISPTIVVTAPSRAQLLPISRFLYSVSRNGLLTASPIRVDLPSSDITLMLDADAWGHRSSAVPPAFGILQEADKIHRRAPVILLGPAPTTETSVHVNLGPCKSAIPTTDELEEITSHFGPKLLAHRLRMVAANPSIPELVQGCPFGVALQIATLQAATDSPKHHAHIVKLFENASGFSFDEALLSIQGSVAEVLFLASHSEKFLTCGDLAQTASDLLKERGEPCSITARRAGSEIRQIGIRTKAIPGGRGIIFDPDIKAKIHQAAFGLDLPSTRSSVPKCAACARLRSVPGRAKPTRPN